MLRIPKLKQPKASSGKKLESGKSLKLHGLEIKNSNKFDVYVDTYKRKSVAKQKAEKEDL